MRIMLNKIINKIDEFISLITILFFFIILLFGTYALIDAYTVYDNAKLSDEILIERPTEEADEEFSLKPLQEINSDICAWLRIDGTNIDYPVVIGKSNSDYLNKDYKKEYSTAGSIFLDYKNNRNFEDDYSIIYGHNMKSGLMFSDIKKFESADFFEENKTGTLFTENGKFDLEVICIARVNAYSSDIYNLQAYNNGKIDKLIKNIMSKAILKREFELEEQDKIILLSTCSMSGSSERTVLVLRCN